MAHWIFAIKEILLTQRNTWSYDVTMLLADNLKTLSYAFMHAKFSYYSFYLFIKALQHKCWKSVGHQVLQPAKDVKIKIGSAKDNYESRLITSFADTNNSKISKYIEVYLNQAPHHP